MSLFVDYTYIAPCRTCVQWLWIGKNLSYGLLVKGSSITNEMHRGTQLQALFILLPKGPTYWAPLTSLSVNYSYKYSSLQYWYSKWLWIGKNLFYGLSAKGSSITNEMHRGTQLQAPFIQVCIRVWIDSFQRLKSQIGRFAGMHCGHNGRRNGRN